MAKLLNNAMSRAAHEPIELREKMTAYIRNILDVPHSGLPALYNARELCLIHDIPSDMEYADDYPFLSEDRGSDAFNSHSIDLQIHPTLAFAAAELGDNDVLKFLIKEGTMIFQRSDGQNVLSCAARNLHESTVKLLVEAGADARWRDEHGCTPVVRALAAWRAREQGFFTP
jgi:ankyrin repeat protein